MRQVPTPQAFHQDAIERVLSWSRGRHERRGDPEGIPKWREVCEQEEDEDEGRRGADEGVSRGGGRREILKDAAPPCRRGRNEKGKEEQTGREIDKENERAERG